MNVSLDCILLAADRKSPDPVANAAGVPCKSLTPIAGQPMLARVLKALEECSKIKRCLVLGPPKHAIAGSPIVSLLKSSWIEWLPPDSSPSLSALAGLRRIPENRQVLLTTADLAFPNPRVFAEFCHKAQTCKTDVAVGLIPYAEVTVRFPKVRRTLLNFSDGPFCTCNLFAFLTPQGRTIVDFWRHLEQKRKHPHRLIWALGPNTVLRYLSGCLSTQELARRVESKLGVKVEFIVLPYPEAAIDVDTVEDLKLVNCPQDSS